MNWEMISAIGTWLAAIATVATAIIAYKTLSRAIKDQEFENKRRKKQITLEEYSILQREVFDDINRYLPSEIKKICEETTSDEYKKLSGHLSRLERFCLGLTSGIYDIDIFYKMAHGYFDDERGLLMTRILPIIEKKLSNAKEDYFENIHLVWKSMKEMNN